ncbi:MAG: hypothetical protein HXY30_09275 [Pseudorhodoplanes sp.]|nr:hypothetical protein [Pseudorhodoplanes sp.]
MSVALAYCIALQMLFAGAVATRHAVLGAISGDIGAICFGYKPADPAGTDGSDTTAIRQLPCVVMGFAAAPAPSAAAAPLPSFEPVARIAILPVLPDAPASPPPSPKRSQGPPLA